MAVLSREQVIGLAAQVGLNVGQIIVAGAICDAESGRNTNAVGINPPTARQPGSRDRGLWQINSYAHPDVSDACAFDPLCNAQAMARISAGGTTWTPWTTYNTGAYRQYLAAYQAIIGAGVTPSVPATDPVGILVGRIRAGYPLLKAVVQTMELVVGQVNARAFGGNPNAADLGSRFL